MCVDMSLKRIEGTYQFFEAVFDLGQQFVLGRLESFVGVIGVGGAGAQKADELIVVHTVEGHLLLVLGTPACHRKLVKSTHKSS